MNPLKNATYKGLRIFGLVAVGCMAMGAFCSCSTLAPITGAGAGAAVGSLFGPGGAALGGAAGAAGGELVYPPEVEAVPPDTIWGLLSKLIDQAAWLAIVVGILYLITLFAPPPKEWFKRKSWGRLNPPTKE